MSAARGRSGGSRTIQGDPDLAPLKAPSFRLLRSPVSPAHSLDSLDAPVLPIRATALWSPDLSHGAGHSRADPASRAQGRPPHSPAQGEAAKSEPPPGELRPPSPGLCGWVLNCPRRLTASSPAETWGLHHGDLFPCSFHRIGSDLEPGSHLHIQLPASPVSESHLRRGLSAAAQVQRPLQPPRPGRSRWDLHPRRQEGAGPPAGALP